MYAAIVFISITGEMFMKNLLLSSGHSLITKGANNKNATYNEYDANVKQAFFMQKKLNILGIQGVDIYDPAQDDRFDIGKHAKGYKLFIDFHLNAFDGKDYYTSCKVDPRFTKPNDLAALIASDFAKAVAEALGNKVYETKGWPKGVMPGNLEVLSGAARVGCPAFLSEAFFIDAYDSKIEIEQKCEVAMNAGAQILVRYLK